MTVLSLRPLQVVYGDKLDNFAEITKLNVGAAVIVTGTLVADAPGEAAFRDPGAARWRWRDLPLRITRCRRSATALEYLRTISHLRPRTNTFQAVFRVRSLIAYAIHKFFQEQGLCLCAHSADHRQRLRGRRRDVPGYHSGSGAMCPRPRTARWTSPRTSSESPPT